MIHHGARGPLVGWACWLRLLKLAPTEPCLVLQRAGGHSSIAPSGGIIDRLPAVVKTLGLRASLHRRESTAKQPGPLAAIVEARPGCASCGPQAGTRASCRAGALQGNPFTTAHLGWYCEAGHTFVPLVDGAGRAPYAMPR